jgi:DNA-binding transcriptional LysR family regulator
MFLVGCNKASCPACWNACWLTNPAFHVALRHQTRSHARCALTEVQRRFDPGTAKQDAGCSISLGPPAFLMCSEKYLLEKVSAILYLLSMAVRKRTREVDWTDLRFLSELVRQGSLSATARALGVTHATVARHITALETGVGRPLFVRQAGRYVPTAIGAQIAALAAEMEEPALRITRAMAGLPMAIAGPLRITATDMVASEMIAPILPALIKAHPALELELFASAENLSLARRDADIAIRLGRPTMGDLFTRKLADLAYFAYASKTYLRENKQTEHKYIGYCNPQPDLPEIAAMARLSRNDQIILRTNQIHARRAAVAGGLGVGLLPKFMADGVKGVVALDRSPVLVRELWLIVHRDLKDVPRIRECIDFMVKAFASQRRRLS